MDPKPRGWSRAYGSAFEEPSAAASYHLRPPYPAAAFDVLAELARGGAVLDAGCGPGSLARPLASLVERVDSVDISAPMLAAGKRALGGDAPNLRWIESAIEKAPLAPPYALIVAGDSVHWFEWEIALPRFADLLSPDGVLALVSREWLREEATRAPLGPILAHHGSPDFAPLDPVEELERRGLFTRLGERALGPEPWRATLDELLGCFHSQSGFVVERMTDPAAFDRDVREAITATVSAHDGRLELDVTATVAWGSPAATSAPRAPSVRAA